VDLDPERRRRERGEVEEADAVGRRRPLGGAVVDGEDRDPRVVLAEVAGDEVEPLDGPLIVDGGELARVELEVEDARVGLTGDRGHRLVDRLGELLRLGARIVRVEDRAAPLLAVQQVEAGMAREAAAVGVVADQGRVEAVDVALAQRHVPVDPAPGDGGHVDVAEPGGR
jgi:hypothetical protein